MIVQAQEPRQDGGHATYIATKINWGLVLKVDGRPYSEVIAGKIITRTFSSETSSEEFQWHRDEKLRTITIVSGSGWSLQYDDSLPLELYEGDVFQISADAWHRILPGRTDLVVNIEEH